MKIALILVGFLALGASASETATENQSVAVVIPEKLNVAKLSHSLLIRDMGDAAWTDFVSKTRSRYKEWSREYDNDNVKHFLDDKLITLAPRVTSGKGASLREFCKWMALYDVFSEPLPHYISDISEKDKRWIMNELSDFDWDRAALRIKEKARQ